jgi:hypothetical protein
LSANREVAERLATLDIDDRSPDWFAIDGIDAPRLIGSDGEAVAASDAVVRATDGSPFTTLFNRFTIDSNPMLRDAVA